MHQYAFIGIRQTGILAASTFRPEGATALYDAVGFAVESASERLNLMPFYQRPKVIVLVATDGAENASRAYTGTQVRSMIQLRRARDKWHFLLLSPNPKSVAKDLGIDPEDAQPWPENGAVLPMFSRIAGRVNQLRLTGGPAR